MKAREWKETDSELDWDFYWADRDWIREVFDYVHLAPNQRVNHFRNHYEVTRKDHMVKNLKRYKKQLQKEGQIDVEEELNFFPVTFNMPNDYALFKDEFNKFPQGTLWIMKPVGRSQGKGIFLFDKLSQVNEWKSESRWKPDNPGAELYVVQRYIDNPLLIGGKKFDLRIYVLCTNYNPLTLYLYRGGFARFTHERYDNSDITNTHLHLTNVAVQKNSECYSEEGSGGKWDLRTLKLYMISKFGADRVNECFYKIQRLIIHTYKSVQKIIINDKHCFELYGLDIMIDSDLKPWLIETNASPSLTGTTQSDIDFKMKLLDDTFTIIDMEKVLSGQEVQVGGFDLIYKDGPMIMASNSTLNSLLGCFNNRITQSKQNAKTCAMRLAQKSESIKSETQDSKKYGKNFSTLPLKTGATYKDSYKEKIKKEKEERGDVSEKASRSQKTKTLSKELPQSSNKFRRPPAKSQNNKHDDSDDSDDSDDEDD